MLAQLSLGFDLSQWETWTAPLVGLSSAGLMLFVARIFFSGPKQAAPPPPAKKGHSQEDLCTPAGIGERRAWIRRRGHAVNVLVSDANAEAEPFAGRVSNRSFGGLCLIVPRAVEVDEILSVRTVGAQSDSPWVQVEVKWCRAREESWELGCQFVRTPPYCQLLLFG